MKHKKELLEWIEKLRDSDRIILVEGKKDKAALRNLGIGNVVQLNKRPLYIVVEELAEKSKGVMILTDLDRKGKQLYAKLNHHLQSLGVKIDNRFRNFLFRKTQLRQIEGMDSYVAKAELGSKHPLV
ncbi:toprim domain-containing protein [Candidatus Woesearchaeota archaeon]|nr:toprim domain-containing protein [Candidatus Woesearchaeota archaeon]